MDHESFEFKPTYFSRLGYHLQLSKPLRGCIYVKEGPVHPKKAKLYLNSTLIGKCNNVKFDEPISFFRGGSDIFVPSGSKNKLELVLEMKKNQKVEAVPTVYVKGTYMKEEYCESDILVRHNGDGLANALYQENGNVGLIFPKWEQPQEIIDMCRRLNLKYVIRE